MINIMTQAKPFDLLAWGFVGIIALLHAKNVSSTVKSNDTLNEPVFTRRLVISELDLILTLVDIISGKLQEVCLNLVTKRTQRT